MTVDKRTPRSRLFKDFLRQPPRPQPSFCDDIPQPIFDFTNGDPALNDLWELLRSVFVSASTMQSPLAPTIRYALLKLDQAAINTTSAMMEMLKFQLPPFTSMPKSIPVSPVEPSISPDISSASLSFADDDVHLLQIIAQLDDLSATLSSVEPKWHEWGHSLTAQVDSVSSIYEQRFSSSLATQRNDFTLQLATSAELLLQSSAELVDMCKTNAELTAELSRLRPAPVCEPPFYGMYGRPRYDKHAAEFWRLYDQRAAARLQSSSVLLDPPSPSADASNNYHAPPWSV